MRYDAVAFLADLFSGEPPLPTSPVSVTPADLPGDWYVAWDERAAIMEFDGGLPREEAESLALADILRQIGQTPTRG